MKYDVETMKDNLKKIRKQKGYTQKEVAKRTWVKLHTIQNAENKDVASTPDLNTICRLCNLYECDLDYVFGNLEHSTHDLDFICSCLGIEERTVNMIKELPNKEKHFLEILINDTDVLHRMMEYVETDVNADGFPIEKERNNILSTKKKGTLKNIRVLETEYIELPKGTTNETIERLNVALQNASLEQIRKELDRISLAECE